MKKNRPIRIIGCIVLLTLFITSTALGNNGIFDISRETETLQPLETQWEFYWKELLEPKDFAAGVPELSGYVQVPGAWNGYQINEENLPGSGYGTYRLTVLMDPDRITAFKIPRILTAYRMWVNGEEVATAGTVGTSLKESTPQYLRQEAFIIPEQEQVEIVIQVSNFQHRSGGILENILTGTEEQVMAVTKRQLAYELLLFGSLLVMGVYHLVLYRYRKKELSLLYYALFCLLISIRTLLVGSGFLIQIFPFFNWELAHKIQTLSYYTGVLLLLLFFQELYTQYVSKAVVKASTLFVGVIGAVVLLTPARIFTLINPLFQVFTLLLSLYILMILFKIYRKKEAGAKFIVFGYVFLIITVFHDLIFHSILMSDFHFLNRFILTGNLSSFGLLMFTLTHSFVLAFKYAKTFNQNEEMTVELRNLNENLEALVENRTEDLQESYQKIEEQKWVLEKTNRKLQMMSQRDGLTNVWNRRYFDEALLLEWRRASRYQESISLLFLDIDNFKIYNDNYGHQEGDRCLQQVATILQEHVQRSADVVARYGGEEFVILLPGTDQKGAISVAETIRKSVESFGVTVSIGIASMVPSSQVSPDDFIHMADQAMYKAKEKGKNRCVI